MSSTIRVVTVVHGTYHAYIAGWVAHLRAAGCMIPIDIIALDSTPLTLEDPEVNVFVLDHPNPVWGTGDYVRLRHIRGLCASGVTCLQIDVDLWFHVDPTRFAALSYPFVISRGLGYPPEAVREWGFSLCTGFYIAKPQALPLLDIWLDLEGGRRSLDQEDLNLHLLQSRISWQHAVSPLVEDAFVTSSDGHICVLSDRAITRDPRFESFGGIHSRAVLERHRNPMVAQGARG